MEQSITRVRVQGDVLDTLVSGGRRAMTDVIGKFRPVSSSGMAGSGEASGIPGTLPHSSLGSAFSCI